MSTTLENATKQIRTYVMLHYGNLLSTEKPSFDKKDGLWKAELKSNYPRLIKNEFPEEERYIRVMPFRGLGTVCFNESFQLQEDCSINRESSIERLRSYLQMWQEKAEKIIVETSARQLADTAPARVFLNPVNKIVDNFIQRPDVILTIEELDKVRSPSKFLRWLKLLEELKLITRKEGGYTYGEIFTSLQATAENDHEFQLLTMAYVLEKSYPLLKEVFGIKQFEALIHLDNCYYQPSLEAERILYQSEKTLFRRFLTEYSYRPEIDLRHNLHELHKSRALCRRNSYYYANNELFEEMLKAKEAQMPISRFPQI